MKILSQTDFPPFLIIIILVAFFGLIVLGVILIKKYVKPLQINKPEIKEEDAIKEELDRILVPIEDEEVQKQMEEAVKKDGE